MIICKSIAEEGIYQLPDWNNIHICLSLSYNNFKRGVYEEIINKVSFFDKRSRDL